MYLPLRKAFYSGGTRWDKRSSIWQRRMVESHLRTTFCKTRGRSLSGVGVPDDLGIGESMAVDQAAGTLPSLIHSLAAESINGTK